ncbi:MAG: maleylpyruvate isomerase N-terminal domain-containing protein, partial [Candidatus Binatia bacterium]
MNDAFDALDAQCKDLVALVGELSDADWERPSRCSGWTVKELIAHCEGMLERLPGYAEMKVKGAAEIDRVGYYGYDPDGPREGEDPSKTFSEVIRDRVVDEAAGRSNDEIRSSLERYAQESVARAREVDPKLVMKRSGHPPMEFGEFVASRVLEFGVHT